MTLVFISCDPGKNAAKVASGKSMDAVALALSRTYLSLELVKGGMDVKVARCGADRLVREFTLAQLNSPNLDKDRVLRTILPCRRAGLGRRCRPARNSRHLLVYSRPMRHNGRTTTSLSFVRRPIVWSSPLGKA